MTRPVVLKVAEDDRDVLERRVAASTTQRRDWQRAKIVLLAAEGMSSPKISDVVGLNRNQVDVWKHRYVDGGIGALVDEARSGRPPVYGPWERLMLTRTITTRPLETDPACRKARLSIPEVGRRIRAAGIPMSDSQVWRIATSMDLKPWQVQTWLTSHDPAFDEKSVDVCGLYLNPPANAVVYSIDEKTGMQATSRINPTRRARPAVGAKRGRRARQEFEYERHGTRVLFGALNVGDGTVEGWVTNSSRADNFIHFLAQLDAITPAHLELHVVADNLSAHGTAAVAQFLEDHQRVFIHRTPTHASWLNQMGAAPVEARQAAVGRVWLA